MALDGVRDVELLMDPAQNTPSPRQLSDDLTDCGLGDEPGAIVKQCVLTDAPARRSLPCALNKACDIVALFGAQVQVSQGSTRARNLSAIQDTRVAEKRGFLVSLLRTKISTVSTA